MLAEEAAPLEQAVADAEVMVDDGLGVFDSLRGNGEGKGKEEGEGEWGMGKNERKGKRNGKRKGESGAMVEGEGC